MAGGPLPAAGAADAAIPASGYGAGGVYPGRVHPGTGPRLRLGPITSSLLVIWDSARCETVSVPRPVGLGTSTSCTLGLGPRVHSVLDLVYSV